MSHNTYPVWGSQHLFKTNYLDVQGTVIAFRYRSAQIAHTNAPSFKHFVKMANVPRNSPRRFVS